MENNQEHIKKIYSKIQVLLKKMSNLQKENDQVKQEMELIRQKETDLLIQVKHLQDQNNLLKSATNNLTTEDKAALEQSINKYVRDIDKCISLLSE